MQPVIYLDVFFALNFLMDFFLLSAVRKISVSGKPLYRTFAAAAIGAVYACIVVITQIKYSIPEMIFTYVIIAALMSVTAFGYGSASELVRHTVLLYMVTFLACGVINVVYYRSSYGAAIDYAAQYEIVPGISLIIFIAGLIIAGSAMEAVYQVVSGSIMRCKTYYIVTMYNNDSTATVKALLDTGNSLTEPISGSPVSVVNDEKILQMMKGDERTKEKFRAVPFHSVGKKAGILEAYRIDCMEIKKDGSIHHIDNPIVAVYRGKLSGKGEYEMLLNKKLI